MFSKEILAKRLRDYRMKLALTQSQLAKFANVNRTTITLIERAERAPSVEVLCALADALDVSIDYLVGRSSEPLEILPPSE